VGDKVRVHVWRDVVVGGEVVIPKGSPIDAHVSMLKTSKVAGKKGKLEISADAVRLGNGEEIPLSGGYGKQGRSNVALAVTLFALVAWPLIFIKGKKAVLEAGTLFDAYTDQEFVVEAETRGAVPKLNLATLVDSPLEAEVLYQELEGQEKIEALPMRLRVCGEIPASGFVVDRINRKPIGQPLRLETGEFEEDGDCSAARATVELKPLVKQFRKGINRFDVCHGSGEGRVATEVILDIQV
jgi:hypothetical protein